MTLHYEIRFLLNSAHIINYFFLKTATEQLDSNVHLVTTVLVEAIQGSEG